MSDLTITSSSENIGQEEMVLKGLDEDRGVVKTEESEEEEVENALAEPRIQTGNDAEIQEATGEEEWPAGSSVNSGNGQFVPEEDVDDDPRSRFVK